MENENPKYFQEMNLPGVRVSSIVICGNKLMFMQQMVGDKLFHVFVGGGVYKNATYEEAMMRELKEEANLTGEIIFGPVSYQKIDGHVDKLFIINVSADVNASLGYDPELPKGEQVLKGLIWRDADIDCQEFSQVDLLYFRLMLDEADKQKNNDDWVKTIKKIMRERA